MQTLEYHGNEVFLCYTHAAPKAKVSLTENINTHAFGGELKPALSFPVLNLAND